LRVVEMMPVSWFILGERDEEALLALQRQTLAEIAGQGGPHQRQLFLCMNLISPVDPLDHGAQRTPSALMTGLATSPKVRPPTFTVARCSPERWPRMLR
jgi:hypothetical protein